MQSLSTNLKFVLPTTNTSLVDFPLSQTEIKISERIKRNEGTWLIHRSENFDDLALTYPALLLLLFKTIKTQCEIKNVVHCGLKINRNEEKGGFDVLISFGISKSPPKDNACIGCNMDAIIVDRGPDSIISRDCLLGCNDYVNVWLDAKGRPMIIVTPVRHKESMWELSDEELVAFWQSAALVLTTLNEQHGFSRMTINHGHYRNVQHLHLKILLEPPNFASKIMNSPRREDIVNKLRRGRFAFGAAMECDVLKRNLEEQLNQTSIAMTSLALAEKDGQISVHEENNHSEKAMVFTPQSDNENIVKYLDSSNSILKLFRLIEAQTKRKGIIHSGIKIFRLDQGFVVRVLYDRPRPPPRALECICCNLNIPISYGIQPQFLQPGEKDNYCSGDCLLGGNESVRVWLDAKGRPVVVVTPVLHQECLWDMTDDQLVRFWMGAMAVVRVLNEQESFERMVINHGNYRNVKHLHLKIFMTESNFREKVLNYPFRNRLATILKLCTRNRHKKWH